MSLDGSHQASGTMSMSAIKAFVSRHPVRAYFALTFVISWGGVLLVIGEAGGIGLPAYRVLMVWVYARIGSLAAMMLMHVSITASTLILEPVAISGVALLVSDLVSIVVWWTVVALIVLANRGVFLAVPDPEAAPAKLPMGAMA